MAMPSVPSAPSEGTKKNVLIAFGGGRSQLDANRKMFEWSALHLFEPGDNVFVFHYEQNSYLRKALFSLSGAAGSSSSATTDAHPQRPGFTVVNIDAPLPLPAAAETATASATKNEVEEEREAEGESPESRKARKLAADFWLAAEATDQIDEDGDTLCRAATVTATAATSADATSSTPENSNSGSCPAEVEWLPRAVSNALRKHRAACPSSIVVVFQIDAAAGPTSAEVSL
jgi:hypothetical protein